MMGLSRRFGEMAPKVMAKPQPNSLDRGNIA